MSAAPQIVPGSFDFVDRVYDLQQRYRPVVAATTAEERIEKLRRLERSVLARAGEIREAMWEDYRKPPAEVDLSEIYPIVSEARHAVRHLRRWMRPGRVATRLALFGARSSVLYEPKGVVLVIAPWNFPFNLALGPVISAIAAGNCVVLKPSELTPASAACIKRIVGDLFDEREVAVIEGDPRVGEALLRKKWDHIFFTGSPEVGKVVMKAAAEHLTAVTLELGGKSPVIVDGSANLDHAARLIAWGKFFNAGQACVAPDYVLVDEGIRVQFLDKLRHAIAALGMEGARSILVNDHHANRVRRLLDDAVARGAQVVVGGSLPGRELEPTVLTGVTDAQAVMQEEIFGPILPVLTFRGIDDAIAQIASRAHPLALYLFSRDRSAVKAVLSRTRAGGTVVNHMMIHFYALDLPFGGVGRSGIGKSHGFYGFQAFSNARSLLEQKLPVSVIELLFPPYSGWLKKKLIELTVRWF